MAVGVITAHCTFAQESPPKETAAFSFYGTEFFLRESPSEFETYTPAGQSDLSSWTEIVNLVFIPHVNTIEQLFDLAVQPLEPHRRLGPMTGYNMTRATESHPKAYLLFFSHGGQGTKQFSMVKAFMHDTEAFFIVYSRRWYGPDSKTEYKEWRRVETGQITDAFEYWLPFPE